MFDEFLLGLTFLSKKFESFEPHSYRITISGITGEYCRNKIFECWRGTSNGLSIEILNDGTKNVDLCSRRGRFLKLKE